MTFAWILFFLFAALGGFLMLRGATLTATITRIENGTIVLREGLIWKKERVLDTSGCRWIETQTVQGIYMSLLLPHDPSPTVYSIQLGAVSHEAIKGWVESDDINWFNEETFHGGGQDQFHCSVKQPMRMDEWVTVLSSR